MRIQRIDDYNRNEILKLIMKNWGSNIMVTRGKVHDLRKLPGFAAINDDTICGIITYSIENQECEIVSLDSFNENKGIGTELLERVIEEANEGGYKRVWLITTNDNSRAIRFYQRKGFIIKNIYIDALSEARKLKPQIPLIGYDDIPIMHEIEFEKKLKEIC